MDVMCRQVSSVCPVSPCTRLRGDGPCALSWKVWGARQKSALCPLCRCVLSWKKCGGLFVIFGCVKRFIYFDSKGGFVVQLLYFPPPLPCPFILFGHPTCSDVCLGFGFCRPWKLIKCNYRQNVERKGPGGGEGESGLHGWHDTSH